MSKLISNKSTITRKLTNYLVIFIFEKIDLEKSENTQLLYQNHVLAYMIRHKRERLLAHPVVTAVNNHLWDSGGFWYFYISIATYLAFLCMVNAFAFIMPPHYAIDTELNRTQTCQENGLLLYYVGISEEHQAIWHKGMVEKY